MSPSGLRRFGFELFLNPSAGQEPRVAVTISPEGHSRDGSKLNLDLNVPFACFSTGIIAPEERQYPHTSLSRPKNLSCEHFLTTR